MRKRWLVFIAFFVLMGCGEKAPEQEAQKVKAQAANAALANRAAAHVRGGGFLAEISPRSPDRNSTLTLLVRGFRLQDAEVQWLVNDRVVSGKEPRRLNVKDFAKKGDRIQARLMVMGRDVITGAVEVKNSLPEIARFRILPEIFKPGDMLSVEVAGSDADGEQVSFLYEWTLNGKLAGKTSRLESPIKRGDKIAIKVTPFDGKAYGKYGLVQREIKNMPPMIVEGKNYSFEGNLYTYQIKAEDKDGDTLAYSLKSGPEGMSIDPSTGLLKWDVPPEFTGKVTFTIAVNDGHGGQSAQSFDLEIKAEQQ